MDQLAFLIVRRDGARIIHHQDFGMGDRTAHDVGCVSISAGSRKVERNASVSPYMANSRA
jgi:hypothetical protein